MKKAMTEITSKIAMKMMLEMDATHLVRSRIEKYDEARVHHEVDGEIFR